MRAFRKAITKVQIAAYNDPSISPEIGRLSHAYPWQIYTKLLGLQLTAKLAAEFPVDVLQAELKAVLAEYALTSHVPIYHVDGWAGITLNGVDGNPFENEDIPGATFAKTEVLKFAPTMESIMDSFPCEKRRVRILKLKAGKKIFWHRDFVHSVDSHIMRLHVPIITSDKVSFQISHQDCQWKAGELWYGDFTFPHRLQNAGTEDRIHLVMDLVHNDEVRALLPASLLNQGAKRASARKGCENLMRAYNLMFATQARLLAPRNTDSIVAND
jgi:hypothetical protein